MTVVSAFLVIAAVAFLAGVAGSYVIARKFSGLVALGAFLIWLAMPVVVLAVFFSASLDPTLSPQQASYDFAMALVLTSIVVAIPWGIANLIGGLIGRRRRKLRRAMPVSSVQSSQWPADTELPDWRHCDQPLLTLDQLGTMMHAIAARAGMEMRWLPHVGPVTGGWGVFIDRDKFDYIYCELERGGAMFDHRVAVADELMYLIFKDRAFAQAATHMARNPTTPDRYDRLLADKQQQVLAGIDPRWGNQFALDRARKAGG